MNDESWIRQGVGDTIADYALLFFALFFFAIALLELRRETKRSGNMTSRRSHDLGVRTTGGKFFAHVQT